MFLMSPNHALLLTSEHQKRRTIIWGPFFRQQSIEIQRLPGQQRALAIYFGKRRSGLVVLVYCCSCNVAHAIDLTSTLATWNGGFGAWFT